jgi:hypothetical protein
VRKPSAIASGETATAFWWRTIATASAAFSA